MMKVVRVDFLILSSLLSLCLAIHTFADESGFETSDGFEMSEVTTPGLVEDVFCMTLDPEGRPVVSGPGYIKTLLDRDQDGVFDDSVVWTQNATQGAQGLWADEGSLLWVSDNGLWLSRDSNGDLRADGRPTRVLNLPTGGEHDAHAIRKGPDGYWYLIAGNFARGIRSLANDRSAAVSDPRGGTLWRISPDFQQRGVYAHGMRNCYDFDFLPDGSVVTYDSDGERDATLPWYRPTRVFQLTPGSDAGWVGVSWKDPNHRITMPRTLAELGRGSPTGVAVYAHYEFPSKYQNAVFVLDWTFGRILALYPQANQPDGIGAETFVQTTGQVGFAPTDIVVEPSGNLLVCVGGRGTRGALYRIRYVGDEPKPARNLFTDRIPALNNGVSVDDKTALENLLLAPCPNETWSEKSWKPLATKLGDTTLASAAVGYLRDAESNQALSPQACAAAIQRLTRLGKALAPSLIDGMLKHPSSTVRAAGWRALSFGRVAAKQADNTRWQATELDRAASEELQDWDGVMEQPAAFAQLECFGWKGWDCSKLFDATRTMDQSPETQRLLRQVGYWSASRSRSKDDFAILLSQPINRIAATEMDKIAKSISAKEIATDQQSLLEVMTLIQSAIGDPRYSFPAQQNTPSPSIFDGYRSLFAQQIPKDVRAGWCRWLISIAEQGRANGLQDPLLMEATRTIAMLEPADNDSLSYALDLVDETTHPSFDIHILLLAAQSSAKRSAQQTARISEMLLGLNDKVLARGLNTDNHWLPRLNELLERLFQNDGQLGMTLLSNPSFGAANHLWIAQQLPKDQTTVARTRVAKRLTSLPAKEWTSALVQFAEFDAKNEPLVAALRTACAEPALQATIIELLAQNPQSDDYRLFLDAMASSNATVWPTAWKGLSKLPIAEPAMEVQRLASYLARTESTTTELDAKLIFARFREAAMKLNPDGIPSSPKWPDWRDYLQQNLDSEQFAAIDKLRMPAGDWMERLAQAEGLQGDTSRGAQLFVQAKCAQCHGGGIALGPSLDGITRRFSKEDLFRAIYEPNRDISDRYRSLQVLTVDGEVFTGLSIYDAADGVTLQTADGTLARINQEDIDSKGISNVSLMPAGLIDGLSPQQLADLFAYMKGL